MFNLGFTELIVLGIIALVFIGPKQLPEVAKVAGRLINEWKRTTSELTGSLTNLEPFRDWEERKQKYFSESDRGQQESKEESTTAADVPNPQSDQLELDLEDPEDKT